MGFVLDVAGYGKRTVPDRDDVQQRLRELVIATLAECGLKLDARVVEHQWTGDGINVILPADIDPTVVLAVLVRSLTAGLSSDNARHTDRIRLRMAIGVGLVERSVAGFSGPVIVDISRLVDSAALRSALADEPAADLAVAISASAHALVIQPGYPGIPGGQFTRVNVVAKEFSGPAWIWVSTRQWSEPAYLPLGATDPREAGGYRIVARLGAGQAGPVYLASGGSGVPGGSAGSGEAEGGWVALKVFDQLLLADPDARRRLSMGVLAASVVREAHIASIIDSAVSISFGSGSGSGQEQAWVASTLVLGPSLASAVTETGPLPAATAGWIALGLARALVTLHEAGLTHHAVSPHNVLLDVRRPVLTDFGISRTALIAGPGIAAQDVLMLGATVFFAVTGRSPWGDHSAATVPVPPPAPAGGSGLAVDLDGCPPWLVPIVDACLAADPATRPTAGELHAWLAGEVGQRPRFWLPDPVAMRVAEYQAVPPLRGSRLWWPLGL